MGLTAIRFGFAETGGNDFNHTTIDLNFGPVTALALEYSQGPTPFSGGSIGRLPWRISLIERNPH